MPEKRDLGRKRKRVKVRFGPEVPTKMAFSADISPRGIFIRTAAPEKPGLMLHLEITLPDEVLVLCTGRIHWAKRVPPNMLRLVAKGGMGVKIMGFSQGEAAYQKFVESLYR
ncbi:MAG: PilZ domain-containing protein [Geopsychrobacter sp.]|nr:PilZ domain-containing protein [Geopsychrobacter sp.]